VSHLSITGWQHTTVAMPILRLNEPIEFVPDDLLDLVEDDGQPVSQAVVIYELGRKCGAIPSEQAWWSGYVAGLTDGVRPCPRKHRGERVHGRRPRTFGSAR
jgi:hypothetical protein